jgi:hypothetical protein
MYAPHWGRFQGLDFVYTTAYCTHIHTIVPRVRACLSRACPAPDILMSSTHKSPQSQPRYEVGPTLPPLSLDIFVVEQKALDERRNANVF